MTLASQDNTISHAADGVQVDFTYDFRVDQDSDMVVYFDGVATVVSRSVSDLGNPLGGTVTFAVAPANGVTVTLTREVPYIQSMSYPVQGPFPSASHELALDRMVMMASQLYEMVSRAIVSAPGADPSTDFTLPIYEAGKGLMWHETERRIVNSDDVLNGIIGLCQTAQALAETAQTNAETAETGAELAKAAAEVAQAAAELAETGAEAQVVLCQDEVVNAAAQVTLAEGQVTLATAQANKAQDWAEEAEDVEVEAGKYSALHWAAKAEEHVTDVYVTNNQWTAGQRYVKDTDSVASGTRNIDLLAEPFIELTVTGDFTLGVTNFANAGLGCELHIIMDGTGGHVVGLSGDLDPAGYDVVVNDTAGARTVFWLTSIGSKVLIRKMWEDD